MRGTQQALRALKHLVVHFEPELLQLSERLVSSSLASTSGASAAAIMAALRSEPALQRLAPRLLSTLAGGGRGGVARQAGQLAGRLLRQQEAQQVRWHCSTARRHAESAAAGAGWALRAAAACRAGNYVSLP